MGLLSIVIHALLSGSAPARSRRQTHQVNLLGVQRGFDDRCLLHWGPRDLATRVPGVSLWVNSWSVKTGRATSRLNFALFWKRARWVRLWCSGFRVWGLGSGLGSPEHQATRDVGRVLNPPKLKGAEARAASGFRVQGSGFRVQGAGCRVPGAGCRVPQHVLPFWVRGRG